MLATLRSKLRLAAPLPSKPLDSRTGSPRAFLVLCLLQAGNGGSAAVHEEQLTSIFLAQSGGSAA